MSNVNDLIENIEKGLSSRRGVVRVDPTAKRFPGHLVALDVRVHFFGGDSFLDIYDFVDTSLCYPQHLAYGYQFMKHGEQVFRYDNAHAHPEVGVSESHKHLGSGNNEQIEESERPSYRAMCDEALFIVLSQFD